MKVFRPTSVEIIEQCRRYFGIIQTYNYVLPNISVIS